MVSILSLKEDLSFSYEGPFFLSQKNTDEQNTQRFTETLSQPISQSVTANRGLPPSPSPNGEGSDHRGYPYYAACVVMGVCHWLVPSIGIL